ncbi:MAG: phosphoglycerate kinase [Candidatus Taylorbacteria bacterium]|nr:phosphoglycerate kinase [Candidatus Taylorbacteria bacterium]
MPQAFKSIRDAKDLKGKRVLLRLDLNVPVIGDEVRDDFRIRRSLPTVEFLKKAGAKTIVISHIENDLTDSLSRVATYIAKTVEIKAFVAKFEDAKTVVDNMREGDVIVMENLRKHPGEKENDPVFAGRLASLADIYVNDAFAVSHRDHASIVSLPRLLPSYAGLLLSEEVEGLSAAFNPPRPFLFIIGGIKFDTKLPLIEKFLDIADYVFVGGALANDIYKEKGYETGRSVVAPSRINLKHVEMSPKLIVPSDVVVASAIETAVRSPDQIGLDEKVVDAGPRTISEISDLLSDVKFVVWNGPLGDYPKGFAEGTESLALALIESGVKTVLGGGDTIAVVSKLNLLDRFSFVSTGGGAMIEFLAKGTLTGIEALKQQ